MAQSAQYARSMSFADFLTFEETAELRHEYIGGQVHAMAGASRNHNIVSGNLFAAIHAHLRGSPCRVFMNDMLLHLNIAQDDIGYYPDLMVGCKDSDKHPRYLE